LRRCGATCASPLNIIAPIVITMLTATIEPMALTVRHSFQIKCVRRTRRGNNG
jgi:hypothetical protein